MLISAASLEGLRTTLDFGFQSAFEKTPTWLEQIASVITSNNKSNTYAWVNQALALREWIGPRLAWNLTEFTYQLFNKKYEGTIEISRDDIEDDNFGMYQQQTLPALGQAAKLHPQRLIAALFAANPVAYDGVTLFNDSHPNFNTTGAGATSYDNNYSLTLDGDGVATAYANMSSFVGADGLPLLVTPDTLIVPPQLRRAAQTVAQSTTYAIPGSNANATVDNVMKGWFNVLVLPELASAPTAWYMADCSKAIKPFIYQSRDTPELTARDNPNDPRVFEQDKFLYGVRMRGNAGVSLPFLIAKCA